MHTDFANWINARRERIGAVFVKGPKVIEFHPHGTAQLIRYIHQNPVRAGVTPTARDCDWTSHRAYAGLAEQPRWLDIEAGMVLGGLDRGAFCEWVENTRSHREDLDACIVQPWKHRAPLTPKRRRPPEQSAVFFRSGGRIQSLNNATSLRIVVRAAFNGVARRGRPRVPRLPH